MERHRIHHYKNALWSDDHKVVLQALEELRSEDISQLLEDVFDVFNNCSEQVYDPLYRFICDIKEPEAVEVFVDRLQHPDFKKQRHALLAACWQTSLAFHEHLPLFVDIAIEGSEADALEVLTLIENNMPKKETHASLEHRVLLSAAKADGLKRTLLEELASLL